jgi:hypothetical protein
MSLFIHGDPSSAFVAPSLDLLFIIWTEFGLSWIFHSNSHSLQLALTSLLYTHPTTPSTFTVLQPIISQMYSTST